MKALDLFSIIKLYENESSIRRRLSPPAAIRGLISLYDEYKDQLNASIPDQDIQALLSEHWQEIKGSKRDYRTAKKLEATERAYVRLAQAFDREKDKKLKQCTYVQIATLMPEEKDAPALSFSSKIDFLEPVLTLDGRAFHYHAWRDELMEEGCDFSKETACIEFLIKKYNKQELLQLSVLLGKVRVQEQEITQHERIKNVINKLANSVDYFIDLLKCQNKQVGTTPIIDIPERYFFRTVDNIGLDIRSLFFSGFVNPVTNKKLAAEDIEKLKSHRHLGFSVILFCDKKDIFEREEKESNFRAEEKTIYAGKKWWQGELSASSGSYAHFCALVELFDHFDYQPANKEEKALPKEQVGLSFIRSQKYYAASDEYVERFVDFRQFLTEKRTKLIWEEMSDNDFFRKAEPIIRQLKVNMGNKWNNATSNFFIAMQSFAFSSDAYSASSSYIRAAQEYLVVTGPMMATREGRKRVIKEIVQQYKFCFDTAYRYGKLTQLMGDMTPSGVCIGEKMRHMAPKYAAMRSRSPDTAKLSSLDTMFDEMMQKARAVEISRHSTWSEGDFLAYLLKNYVGKEYLDKDGNTQKLDESTIRNYLIDILCYTEISRPRGWVAPAATNSMKNNS